MITAKGRWEWGVGSEWSDKANSPRTKLAAAAPNPDVHVKFVWFLHELFFFRNFEHSFLHGLEISADGVSVNCWRFGK